MDTQSKAIAKAGINGVKPAVKSYWAYWISIAFSLTIDAQSADGGCIPIPKKLRLDIVKIININLNPNSIIKGDAIFGRISLKIIYGKFSPLNLATSTYSKTTWPTATDLEILKNLVDSKIPKI